MNSLAGLSWALLSRSLSVRQSLNAKLQALIAWRTVVFPQLLGPAEVAYHAI